MKKMLLITNINNSVVYCAQIRINYTAAILKMTGYAHACKCLRETSRRVDVVVVQPPSFWYIGKLTLNIFKTA